MTKEHVLDAYQEWELAGRHHGVGGAIMQTRGSMSAFITGYDLAAAERDELRAVCQEFDRVLSENGRWAGMHWVDRDELQAAFQSNRAALKGTET